MSNRLLLGLISQVCRPDKDLSADDDHELLHRFHREGDEQAFSRLVHRHGRLVWMVCRQILANDADAEDAYQATFIVLLKSASLIRGPLAPWLHRVSYRVALKQRSRLNQRHPREQMKARREATYPVPDSAWETLLIAVHEEVAQLPETQRIPFVLCCLEGKPTTIAAKQVGWKLGTFSGRLTLAKQNLLARLEKRGLPLTAVGLTVAMSGEATALAPSLLVLATQLAKPSLPIAKHLLFLAQGVGTMKSITTKWLAAALISVSMVGAGTWLAAAGQEGKGAGAPTPVGGNAAVVTGTGIGSLGAMMGGPQSTGGPGMGSAIGTQQQSHWEYLFVQVSPTTQKEYRQVFRQYETAGWELAGSLPEVTQTATPGSAPPGNLGVGLGGPPALVGSSNPGGGAGIGAPGGGGAGVMAGGETTTSTSLVFKRRVSHVVGGMSPSSDPQMGMSTGLPGSNGTPTKGATGSVVPMGLGGTTGGRTIDVSALTELNSNLEENDVKRLLNGSWQLSKQLVDGKERSTSALYHLQFNSENQLTSDLNRKSSYFVNATKSPQELNIVGNGTLLLCIFQVKGDSLQIAFYGRSEYDRPKSFDHTLNKTSLPLHVMQYHRESEKTGGPSGR